MSEPALVVDELHAFYGHVEALHGVSLRVAEGEIVALVGPNGAGKTSLLRAVSGELRTRGSITFRRQELTRRRPFAIARLGVGHLPEGRGTFIELTVEENLRLACGATGRSRKERVSPDEAYELFPALGDLQRAAAGSLSGGQQQMLAVCRAVLARPELLMIDEPCVGLAPVTSAEVFGKLRELITGTNMSVLLAEQNVARALGVASRAYVLSSGRITASGAAADLQGSDEVRAAYLGGAAGPPTAPGGGALV